MTKNHIKILVLFALLFGLIYGCDGCGTHNYLPVPDFTVSCEIQDGEDTIHFEENKKVQFRLLITPTNEIAEKKVPYYNIINWEIAEKAAGDLLDNSGNKVTIETQFKNGENILFYEPKELGIHTIKVQVTDKYQDPKIDALFPSLKVQNKPAPKFKAFLRSISKNIFHHKNALVELEITSDELEGNDFPYTIKSIQSDQGDLYFEDGKELKVGSKLTLGIQKLMLNPSIKVGKVKVKLEVSNGANERLVKLDLELKPLIFNLDLSSIQQRLFTYQDSQVALVVDSKEEGANHLNYQVKSVEVLKGDLQFEGTGKSVAPDDPLKYGIQHFIFKPNGEEGQARANITVVNVETKSEATGSIAYDIKPIKFKASAWLREPKEEEKELVIGNFGVLEVMLSGIDAGLLGQPWKISSYQFSDGVQRDIVDHELKQLSEFPIDPKIKNTLYLPLPGIKLDQEPNLTLQIEGPGKSIQQVSLGLASVQQSIITTRENDILKNIQAHSEELDTYAKLPASGKTYDALKTVIDKTDREISLLKDLIHDVKVTSSGLRHRELDKITKKIDSLQKKKEKIDALKKESKKQKTSFTAVLQVGSTSILNSQSAQMALEISSTEEEASNLLYSVKNIEITEGTLHFENGQEVTVGSEVSFGKQQLLFKPTNNVGASRIKLAIKNNKQNESTTGAVLDIKPAVFKAELTTSDHSIFSNQVATIELAISSSDEAANSLDYVVKEVIVKNGSLHFGSDNSVIENNSKLRFGKQTLIFRPTWKNKETVQASIRLVTVNGKGAQQDSGLTISIKPTYFKTNAWLREPRKEEKGIMPGDFGVLEVMLADIDTELLDETWKISSYQFSDGVQRDIVDHELKQLSEFPIDPKIKNTLYLPLPDIKLDQEPNLTLQMEGPGKSIQQVKLLLASVQKSLVRSKVESSMAITKQLNQNMKDLLKSPINGSKAANAQELLQEYRAHMDATDEHITEEMRSAFKVLKVDKKLSNLKNNKTLLDEFKRKCEERMYTFKPQMHVANRSLSVHQSAEIELSVHSDEHQAESLVYRVKDIEIANGILTYPSGELVQAGSPLIYGKQNVVFHPADKVGSAKVNMTIANDKAAQANVGLVLDVKHAPFKAKLNVGDRKLFNHQSKSITLEIFSNDASVKNLEYTIQELDVKNGKLLLGDGTLLSKGSKLKFGRQDLFFHPKIDSGESNIQIKIGNGKGSENVVELSLEVLPVNFRTSAWARDPKEAEKKLLQGNFSVLELKLSDIDSQLEKGPFNLIGWSFSSDPIHSAVSDIGNQLEFKKFGSTLQDLTLSLLEGGNEKTLYNALDRIENKKKEEDAHFKHGTEYLKAACDRYARSTQAVDDKDRQLKQLTTSLTNNSLQLGALHEAKFQEQKQQSEKHKLNIEVQQMKRQLEIHKKKFERDTRLKEAHEKKNIAKNKRLMLALKTREELKDAKSLAPSVILQPKLLDTSFNQLSSYPLKTDGNNIFYIQFPDISVSPTLTLKIEGPGGTVKESVLKLGTVIQPLAEQNLQNALEKIRSFSIEMNKYLDMQVNGGNYEIMRSFIRKKEPEFKETFKELETSYGQIWWKNSMILSTPKLNHLVDEMVALEKKRDKLELIKKECKQKKYSFKVDASLKQPQADHRLMVMDYAVLKIKLSNIDKSLENENWSLLDWRFSDNLARGIVDKDLNELMEFPLNINQENDLLLKLPSIAMMEDPRMILEIGVLGKVVQEVTLEVGPVQRAVEGAKISKFLTMVQSLNKDIDSYLKLSVKEKTHARLLELNSETKIKIDIYNEMYGKVSEQLKGDDPKLISKLLPGEAGSNLVEIIEKEMPELRRHAIPLQDEEDEWSEAINDISKSLGGGLSTEQLANNIHQVNSTGDLLIHKLFSKGGKSISNSASEFVISRTANINVEDKHKNAALLMAAKTFDIEKMRIILKYNPTQNEKGPDMDGNGEWYTPLHILATNPHPDSYKMMEMLSNEFYIEKNYYQKIEIHDSPSNSKDKLLLSIIMTDAFDANEKLKRAKLVIPHLSAQNVVRGINQGGCSNKLRDLNGWSPLYAAWERGYTEISFLILDRAYHGVCPSSIEIMDDNHIRKKFRVGDILWFLKDKGSLTTEQALKITEGFKKKGLGMY